MPPPLGGPKRGDHRIRQTDKNVFFIEYYGDRGWERVGLRYHYNGLGEKTYTFPDTLEFCRLSGYYYENSWTSLTVAQSLIINDENRDKKEREKKKFRKENYVNVYYPTEYKKEKYNEEK